MRQASATETDNALPEIDLWCFRHNPSILQLFPIGKIAKALQPEGNKELLRGDEGIRRPAPRRSWPSPDQVARMQPPDQIAADLFPEDVLEPVSSDRLVVGDGGQHCDVELGVCSGWGQNDTLRSDVIDFSTCIRP